jgi:DNA-binding FadR family transcriptional regulator
MRMLYGMAGQTRASVREVDTIGGEGLTGLHARTLDRLGTVIASGGLPAGSVLYIDDLAEEHGVSRSVVREVLSSMGLVESRRRMGTQIRPAADWNVFDPQVIRWRLASDERIGQLRSITELRSAVEPEAARLAALRADRQEASELVALAAQMWAAGKDGDVPRFLELDIEFHREVLRCSGNEMFLKLNEIVAAVLIGRTEHGLMPHHPDDEALQLHADVAHGIQRGDGAAARSAMVRIMEQAMDEMSSLWPRSEAD